MEKKCIEHEMCFVFSTTFARNVFLSDKYLVIYARNLRRFICKVGVNIFRFGLKFKGLQFVVILLSIRFHTHTSNVSRVSSWLQMAGWTVKGKAIL
jgi:hypothetical protein